MFPNVLTSPALVDPTDTPSTSTGQGEGPRQTFRKDEVYMASRAAPAPREAFGWSGKSRGGKRKRESRRRTRGGSRWPHERRSRGCRASKLAQGECTIRICGRRPAHKGEGLGEGGQSAKREVQVQRVEKRVLRMTEEVQRKKREIKQSKERLSKRSAACRAVAQMTRSSQRISLSIGCQKKRVGELEKRSS